ncbi:MAG TPA: DUF3489 domain-containing protein [Devosia sp.]|jgi:hypothetical protein|uniref:DUF3489 domain-containing protein n=1 Tax=Devosia sp. TaxID=1871048 RepID=UPI002DDCF3BF|nr:DUF3489 domain-containing protein [Devosia sp.]HEV2514260.1 DUF3489 domain-containing protein [Devosia sp.]
MAKKPGNANTEPVSAVHRATKQDLVLSMLRHQEGASIAEICKATGWQAHSARGFLSGALKRRLKIEVTSERNETGERRYHVAPIKSVD